ncbi:poly(A)-specific ribonuclease PARN-like isoform X1 [Bombus pyrosoma]|uniref:poly(A)-specific ribonuclease PARN-like isoform X1 n=1 Tax=Bombus pyrosoma TaxID=396416 RepID=UPI001CB9B10E|nr:poly(A)-specific ribonuclease PARN-like isoform X1 [Bombus pyrosoma]
MEVTSLNFEEVLVELDEVIKNGTFLAIDGEFTGLNSGPDAGAFDTPAQYYGKLRSGSMDFLLIQFGLSVFTFNTQTQKYNQRSYNFYVFPRPLNRTATDLRFMCQTSCMSFLASREFDFNKLFKLGIPYLTASEEEKLIKRLEEKQRIRDETLEILPISDVERPQIEDICRKMDEFITSEEEELVIDKCSAFIRRLVYQEAKLRWPNKLRIESKMENFGCSLVVQRLGTKEEEEQREIEKREKERTEIQHAVGLSKLMRKIADSGKLLVGHNMLLDLCHIIHQFFGYLPESYLEFKSLLHSLFPRILDTKIICHSQQFKENVPSSNLGILLETVSKSPFKITEVEPIDDRSYSTLTEKCHEAGYDAYITGICFIALSNYLGSLQNPEVPIVLSDSSLLDPFINKLLIARLKDIPYINLVGEDPNPNRDHILHITFPKEWRFNDISQLFSPFGGVHVSWLNDTSAYIGLHRRDQVNAVMKILGKTNTYKIQRYADYQASVGVTVGAGDRKRKLLSSETVSPKKGENSVPTNGVKTTKDDDGWEVATGNDLELSSESIIPCSYPHERSRATSKPRSYHEADETLLFEQMKVEQKIRLKNSLSLPMDFQNEQKKDAVPKYTTMKRNAVTDNDYKVDDTREVPKNTETKSSNMAKDNRYNSLILNNRNCKPGKTKKSNSNKGTSQQSVSMQTGSCSNKLPERKSSVSTKYKESEASVESSFSLKKTASTTSSPSTSPHLGNRTKKQSKTKPIVVEKFCNSKNTLALDKKKFCSDNKKQNASELFFNPSDSSWIEQRFSGGKCLFIILAKVFTIIFLYYIAIKTD